MLHQDNGGVQKPRLRRRRGYADQGSVGPDQTEVPAGAVPAGLNAGSSAREIRREVRRSQVLSMQGPAQPLRRQRAAGKSREHVGHRDDRLVRGGDSVWTGFEGAQRHRLRQGQLSAAAAAERDEMRPHAEPLTEIVRQRPDVEAGAAPHAERHRVVGAADHLDRMRGHFHWGG